MRSSVLLVLLAAAACASTDHSHLVKPTPESGPVATYRGTVRVVMPETGAIVAEYPALVRRTYDPRTKMIVAERVVDRGGGVVDKQVVRWDVGGDECAVSEEDGMFSGRCEMVGQPWRWHAWRAVLQRPVEGQVWIEEREEKVTAGGLLATSRMRTADGLPGIETNELYDAVPPAEFEALWLRATR